MKHWLITLLATGLLSFTTSSFALSEISLPKKKQTDFKLYLTAKQANKMISSSPAQTLFVDVRTRAEVNFLGMPTSADANIPYFTPDIWSDWDSKKRNFKLSPNSGFLGLVEERLKLKGLTKNDTVILMCRSGSRSAKAANLLHKAGYKKVYTVIDGFEGDKAKSGPQKGQRVVNGWKNSNLPWSYKLDKDKMYFEL